MTARSESSQQWLRLGGIAAIGAGLSGVTFEVLGFLSHGPTGSDRKIPVFGLLNADYQRLLIVSGVLTLWALVVLYNYLRTHLGRLGWPGFLLLIGAYTLAPTALLLDYVIFPYPHPGWGIGFFMVVFFVTDENGDILLL